MVPSSPGAVVLIPFPFSDLSRAKFRPAVVLADAGRRDWILCQVTSKAYADPRAIAIADRDFAGGSLQLLSYARPGMLFTANEELIASQAGTLTEPAFTGIIDAVVWLLQSSADRGSGNT